MGSDTRRRRAGYRSGLLAESAAALLLRAKGWRILARRMRTPVGEIDIVAERNGTVAFVEVKLRRDLATARGALAPRQRRRLENAARWWLAANPRYLASTCRFDLVAVNRWLFPVHLPNIHEAGGRDP